MANSPHRRWKGCPVCKPNKFRGHGRARRDPWAVRRQLGTKRRAGRHDVTEEIEDLRDRLSVHEREHRATDLDTVVAELGLG